MRKLLNRLFQAISPLLLPWSNGRSILFFLLSVTLFVILPVIATAEVLFAHGIDSARLPTWQSPPFYVALAGIAWTVFFFYRFFRWYYRDRHQPPLPPSRS